MRPTVLVPALMVACFGGSDKPATPAGVTLTVAHTAAMDGELEPCG